MFFRQLRNELIKLFGKKRTYIGFGVFLFAQNAMLIAFRFTNWQRQAERMLEGNGYLALDYISALTVALIMLIPQIALLMPLYTCLVGGDLVAKEAEDGSLRMILARPISRVRLLGVKWCAGVIFSIVLVVALGAMALLFARMWFPWQGMFVFIPPPDNMFNVLSATEGLQRFALAHVFHAINAATMMTIAFTFGCFNMKPAAALVLGVSFMLLNLVIESIPFFEDYRPYLLLHHFRAWMVVYGDPVNWPRIWESVCVLIGFNFTCFAIGATGFQLRDIKS